MKSTEQAKHVKGELKVSEEGRLILIRGIKENHNTEAICTVHQRRDESGAFTTEAIANAKRIVKCANMHNEAMDALLALVRESKSNTPAVKMAVELLNRDKEQ